MTNQPTHYIAGSGDHGCLYDQSGVYRSLDDAVSSMADLFSLGRGRRQELTRHQYLELNPRRDGASYVEITDCDCAEPWTHDEMGDPADWQDDVSSAGEDSTPTVSPEREK